MQVIEVVDSGQPEQVTNDYKDLNIGSIFVLLIPNIDIMSTEKRVQSFAYRKYDTIDSLESHYGLLLKKAEEQLDHAYAPYSNFHVGAAVQLIDGTIYGGSNQENASYPLCMCAERVALYNAAVHSPGIAPETIAITVRKHNGPDQTPVSPCGACRQVIAENEFRFNRPVRLILGSSTSSIFVIDSISDILPFGFNQTYL
jgi:cytidine deaminase